MAQAETIRGPVDGESLGQVLAHKHLLALGLGRSIPRVQITTMLADNSRRYFTGAQA